MKTIYVTLFKDSKGLPIRATRFSTKKQAVKLMALTVDSGNWDVTVMTEKQLLKHYGDFLSMQFFTIN